jgi:hypothetical protein
MPEEMNQQQLAGAIEQERARWLELLPRFNDEQWQLSQRADGWTAHDIVAHVADSNYGLALMALGEIKPQLPLNPETGWMDVDDYNEQRRARNASLPRAKITERLSTSLDHMRRAIEGTDDMDAPSPIGPPHTMGTWLRRMVQHNQEHRQELEQMMGD